jgi:signal transduction histidine kinase
VRTPWDWLLVAGLVSWSLVEAVLRDDLAWPPVALAVVVVVALALLWRRTHPLASVAVAFGALIAFDLARVAAGVDPGLHIHNSVAGALLLPYALFRWGAGREAAKGLLLILVWLVVTRVADPVGAWETAGLFGFFLFSAALGAAIRFHTTDRARAIEEVKLRPRNELARELHDAVGHHISGIAVQAQAGRALAAAEPTRALAVLETIERTASRALEEMRAMVGVLRDEAEAQYVPQPGVADIERLARSVDGGPRVEVRLPAGLDGISPSVAAALYRIAQEAVTNALRHARHASRITVDVADEGDVVRLTVRDDGEAAATGRSPAGYGLAGMTERAALLGGTLRAGPDPGPGWTVRAVLPKGGAS